MSKWDNEHLITVIQSYRRKFCKFSSMSLKLSLKTRFLGVLSTTLFAQKLIDFYSSRQCSPKLYKKISKKRQFFFLCGLLSLVPHFLNSSTWKSVIYFSDFTRVGKWICQVSLVFTSQLFSLLYSFSLPPHVYFHSLLSFSFHFILKFRSS